MLILRRITSQGFESNNVVGDGYDLIHSVYNPEKFEEIKKIQQFNDPETIYAYLVYKNGSEVMPLRKLSNYYMMTDKGSTFANLSLK